MADVPADWAQINKRAWDERAPIHAASDFYDVEGLKAGQPQLQPFEVEELGPLGGLRLAHLQCHLGTDLLDMVRLHPGLVGVGLDFSAPALDAARALAAEMGVADRVSFVEADVRDAARALGAGTFDAVYTGKGAICWLPDLDHWAAECAALLGPGGWLYLSEFHPVGYALGIDEPVLADDYFRGEPWIDEESGTYASREGPTEHNLLVSWNHSIAAVLNAVIGAGLELRFFHEHDYTLFGLNDWLVPDPGPPRRFRFPDPARRLPLMYSLKAYKPPA